MLTGSYLYVLVPIRDRKVHLRMYEVQKIKNHLYCANSAPRACCKFSFRLGVRRVCTDVSPSFLFPLSTSLVVYSTSIYSNGGLLFISFSMKKDWCHENTKFRKPTIQKSSKLFVPKSFRFEF